MLFCKPASDDTLLLWYHILFTISTIIRNKIHLLFCAAGAFRRIQGGATSLRSSQRPFYLGAAAWPKGIATPVCGLVRNDRGSQGCLRAQKYRQPLGVGGTLFYLANSTALVSRITFTLIWPGYSSSASIFLAMSRARRIMLSSVTTSGLTMMRTSRPAWMA